MYREAEKELTAVSQDATRGLTDLGTTILNRTRALSLTTAEPGSEFSASTSAGNSNKDGDATTPTAAYSGDISSEDAIKESETVLSRLRGEAAKRLKDLQKAEDAADEALLRFGSNLRDFLKDAIKVAPPTEASSAGGEGSAVLFESKDAQGKRVIHTSRFDAQLHVIHTSNESFTKDAMGPEFEVWYEEFDAEKKTGDIAKDLDRYPELRATMEKLVPGQVPYADFWKRYYFLRHGIETAEARRRDLLKGMISLHNRFCCQCNANAPEAASTEEEVGWDEDSDDEAEPSTSKAPTIGDGRPRSTESSATLHPQTAQIAKPSEPRKSNDEKSQADSEASYDVVGAQSGVPSQAPNSPKDSRKGDDSDEEDWE